MSTSRSSRRLTLRIAGTICALGLIAAACGDSNTEPPTADPADDVTATTSAEPAVTTVGETVTHDHGELLDVDESAAPTIDLVVVDDPMGGHNLRLDTTNFTFAPERVSTEHVDGEGHAHLYIDGTKITRIYGQWHQLPPLDAGTHTITVELSANDHRTLAIDGTPITDSETLVVVKAGDDSAGGHDHGGTEHEADDHEGHDHDHSTADDAGAADTSGADVVFEVEVVDASVVGGVEQVEVDLGQTVALVVTNDADDELHLHGYDVFTEVVAGEPSVLVFEARIPGVFEAELEGRGQRLIEFEIS